MEDNKTRSSFYVYYENLKNQLYRQVSGSREGGFFWPSYYYNWFYTQEKTIFSSLRGRQQLGPNISNEEINEYNTIRDKLSPYSKFLIVKEKGKTPEGCEFDQITLKRKNNYLNHCLGLGLFSVVYLQLTHYWFFFSFIPIAVLKYHDSKFMPYEEYNNFFSYVQEKRSADDLYHSHKKTFSELINSSATNKKVAQELENTGKSLEEAVQDIYNDYLNAVNVEVKK